MDTIRCTQCGLVGLEPGFLEDCGQGSPGYTRWIAGALERGRIFGFGKTAGKPRWLVDAFRCPQCGHLELFAVQRS